MKKRFLCTICVLLFILGFAFGAFASMGSENFRIPTSVLSCGVTAMSSANFEMNSTLGQPSPLLDPDDPPGSENFGLSPGFWYTIDIVLSEELTVTMNLPSGWSMISLPVMPNDFSVSYLFPDAVVVYDYVRGQGYVHVKKFEIGEGYWILLDQNQSYTPSGKCIQSYSKTVNEDGWEMIGGCTYPVQASTDSCQISVIYKFVQGVGYQRLTESKLLMPGNGYWILLENVVDQCELTVEVIYP